MFLLFMFLFSGPRGSGTDQQFPVSSCQRGRLLRLQPLLRCAEPAPWETGGHAEGRVWRETLPSCICSGGMLQMFVTFNTVQNCEPQCGLLEVPSLGFRCFFNLNNLSKRPESQARFCVSERFFIIIIFRSPLQKRFNVLITWDTEWWLSHP